jgi:hypothetical protein
MTGRDTEMCRKCSVLSRSPVRSNETRRVSIEMRRESSGLLTTMFVSFNDDNQLPPAEPMAEVVRGHGLARLRAVRAAKVETKGTCSSITTDATSSMIPTRSRRTNRNKPRTILRGLEAVCTPSSPTRNLGR